MKLRSMTGSQVSGTVRIGMRVRGASLAEQLTSFRLENATCFDPNEEGKIKRAIQQFGTELFVKHVRALGTRLQEQQTRQEARPSLMSDKDLRQLDDGMVRTNNAPLQLGQL